MSNPSRALVVVPPGEDVRPTGEPAEIPQGAEPAPTVRRPIWYTADQLLNGLLLAALVVAVAAAQWLRPSLDAAQDPSPAASSEPSPYVTSQVVRGALSVRVAATGTVEPARLVEVSSELSGTIKSVLVDNNDRVKAGQILAELDDETLAKERDRASALVAAARARLTESEAGVSAAERNLDRKRSLARGNLVPERDVDLAAASVKQTAASVAALGADLAAAKAGLEIAETNLRKVRIVSPIDGIVLRRNVEPGQTVAASLQAPVLFRLAENLERMQIRVDIDEADALNVRDGQKATFGVQALRDVELPAKVDKLYIGPEIIQGVVTYKAILAFDNRKLALKPGMTATAEIEVETIRDGLLVPNAALRFSPPEADPEASRSGNALIGGIMGQAGLAASGPRAGSDKPAPVRAMQRHVHIVENGRLRPVLVEIGASDGTSTHVVSGPLKEGDRVAVDLAPTSP